VLRYHGVIAEGGTGGEKRPKGGSTFNRAEGWRWWAMAVRGQKFKVKALLP
jgi:hypothetical protein